MFHRHRWKVVSREEQPSALEVITDSSQLRRIKGDLAGFAERPVIVHYRCRCGQEKVVRV